MTSAPIEIRGLRKSFGSVNAVTDATFSVAAGRVTGFLGPNGAGKTTTLRMLLGLIRPSGGTALVQGKRYRDHSRPARLIGAVVDIAGAHPRMTATQHLRTYSALSGLSPTRAEAVLAQLGATAFADRRIGTFSTGMRQRLSLATALLGEPEILVLDEPFNGLDPAGVVWLREFLQQFARSGGTAFLSSHMLAELEHAVDDVVLIDRGRVAHAGSLSSIRASDESLEDMFLRATQGGEGR